MYVNSLKQCFVKCVLIGNERAPLNTHTHEINKATRLKTLLTYLVLFINSQKQQFLKFKNAIKVEAKGNQRMLSNGLHGQWYHSLTVFVPTIICPHYCQLAQHLYPDANRSTCGAARGTERAVWSSERAVWSSERAVWSAERELSGAQRESESCMERRKGHQEHRGRRYLWLFTAGCLRLVFCSGW